MGPLTDAEVEDLLDDVRSANGKTIQDQDAIDIACRTIDALRRECRALRTRVAELEKLMRPFDWPTASVHKKGPEGP